MFAGHGQSVSMLSVCLAFARWRGPMLADVTPTLMACSACAVAQSQWRCALMGVVLVTRRGAVASPLTSEVHAEAEVRGAPRGVESDRLRVAAVERVLDASMELELLRQRVGGGRVDDRAADARRHVTPDQIGRAYV